MATSLSEEEFHRMQLQLLELRTTNYELDGKYKQFERESKAWQEKCSNLEKDLQRSVKAVQKSKKAKEIEEILQENEGLQRKIESQEEDFRLQNQALMNELATLVSSNEDLEKKLSITDNHDSGAANKSGLVELEGEITRLKAFNQVLQANLDAHSTTFAQDSTDAPREQNKGISDIQIRLEAEITEKKLVQDRLEISQGKSETLQAENDKLTEKLKKKQESFTQLQSEKEQLFSAHQLLQNELQSVRDRDKIYYTEQIAKLQQEISNTKQTYEELQRSSHIQISQLQSSYESEKQQRIAADTATQQELKQHTSHVLQQLNSSQTQLNVALKRSDDLNTQLQESKTLNQTSSEQLYAVQQERDIQIQALQEANKLAEKRKSLLDDLAIKYQQDADSHHKREREAEERYREELETLQHQMQHGQARAADIEKLKRQIDELKSQVTSLDEAKGWLERRLAETDENLSTKENDHQTILQQLRNNHESAIDSLKQVHAEYIESLGETHEKAMGELRDNRDQMKQELDGRIEEIQTLHQSMKDKDGEKKIHEKKGLTMLKDLKRQLHSERKRAEKLQERLQEVLSSDSRDNIAVSELFDINSANNSFHTDGSSVSAWSVATSGSGNREYTSNIQSPTQESNYSDEMDKEYTGLLTKIGAIQQSKWQLEEKVKHLEDVNGAMADEILNKAAIIEHYVMDGRTDPKHHSKHDKITLKKVLDIVNKGDVNVKEMNKKLQRMLEETLTKNMHLQQDMDKLSVEIVRLSKLALQNHPQHSNNQRPNVLQIHQATTEKPHSSQTHQATSEKPHSSPTHHATTEKPHSSQYSQGNCENKHRSSEICNDICYNDVTTDKNSPTHIDTESSESFLTLTTPTDSIQTDSLHGQLVEEDSQNIATLSSIDTNELLQSDSSKTVDSAASRTFVENESESPNNDISLSVSVNL